MTDSGRENNPNALLQTMDASIWAKEFCRHTKFEDESWALSWMANAIMTGWDHAFRKAAAILGEAGRDDAAEIVYPGWLLLKELRAVPAGATTSAMGVTESAQSLSSSLAFLEARWREKADAQRALIASGECLNPIAMAGGTALLDDARCPFIRGEVRVADGVFAAHARQEIPWLLQRSEEAAAEGFDVRTLAAEYGWTYTGSLAEWLRRQLGALAAARQELEAAQDACCEAYTKAKDNWCAQCFCFTSAPESLRRDAHEVARDGFNTIAEVLGRVAIPIYRAEYRAAEAEAKAEADLAAARLRATPGKPDVRGIIEALGFDPTNHHNAMACPYCNPERLRSTRSRTTDEETTDEAAR